jgi:hypothetical protein
MMGRRPIRETAMSAAERQRRHRARQQRPHSAPTTKEDTDARVSALEAELRNRDALIAQLRQELQSAAASKPGAAPSQDDAARAEEVARFGALAFWRLRIPVAPDEVFVKVIVPHGIAINFPTGARVELTSGACYMPSPIADLMCRQGLARLA